MYTSYDVFDNLEPSLIYLAKPGQRIISALPGIEEDTCRLEKNFNNTSVLEFTIDRDINGEINPLYDTVGQHYELFVTGYGWFKINELPQISSDGDIETKTIRAESLEIELQQYDLVNFEINTASVSSKEMLATDNTYQTDDGYTVFRDQVLFYRDTSDTEELYDEFISGTSSISRLESLIPSHPKILESWRIDFNYDTFDSAIDDACEYYTSHGQSSRADSLRRYRGTIHTKDAALTLTKVFTELLNYVHITVEQRIDPKDASAGTYTLAEVIDVHIKRMQELSLLTLILKEHGWNVGTVDDWVDPTSDDPYDKVKLANAVGMFEVDSQDCYSFLT